MTGTMTFSELECGRGKRIGIAAIDNPSSLNALTLEMLRQLSARLAEWEKDDQIACVFLHSDHAKAFCAGGDVRAIYKAMVEAESHKEAGEAGASPESFLTEYFSVEYRCDYQIHQFKKPLIAWGEGIVMGGGIGLYIGAGHRVVTPSSMLAMPEISIGLYPDVGGTWFLNQLPAGVGLFLGLTGARVNASDALDLKMADHILLAEHKSAVFEALQAIDWQSVPDADQAVSDCLREFAESAKRDWPPSQMIPYFPQIQAASVGRNLEEICQQIMAIDGLGTWLETAKSNLKHGSPVSAHICYRQLKGYRDLTLADCFRLELGLSVRCGLLGEFQEGVRARLIDKSGEPTWLFSAVSAVDESVIDDLFAPMWQASEHPLADLGAESMS
ncbi:enoyl-CoA hydratase/isomerase family protein [Photobacterium sp. CCB-ST2H9]|uniref:enoyl-CoA hydratase/isomerase family protein n=1 Tax=Photobacterium sp. CCB-ST2H9 TaxID=2912855 RepID=UPI0020033408|nr:enoyl-CoA hydratase/isomerase family protein [Photobacterium sp. CCB-ST2H9]UTM60046.1 enoyl-CoA hydratase/isomerase family protein [Photobacterium sp. CCB-ST2H9]